MLLLPLQLLLKQASLAEQPLLLLPCHQQKLQQWLQL
jgi:hypothetical protein